MEDALYAMVCVIAVVQSILAIIMIVCMIFRLKKSKRVCVLVIGDIGRSPRMQNHAISLAEFDFQVDFVGLSGKIYLICFTLSHCLVLLKLSYLRINFKKN